MAIDNPIPRTRRAILAASLGGLAATVAAALGRPTRAHAANGDAVILGLENLSTTETGVTCGTDNATAFYGHSNGVGNGLLGESSTGAGVRGTSTSGSGVAGTSTGSATGVWGATASGMGVHGQSTSGTGVHGNSQSSYGVRGISPSYVAVKGESVLSNGIDGTTDSGIGVQGSSNSSWGVHGVSQSSWGVYGWSTTGVGVYASTSALKSGFALQAVGRVKFDNSAGLATIAAGTKKKTVTPGINLTSNSAVVATLQGSAGGTTTVHRVIVDPATDKFTIYLTANAAANVKVAWHVFG